jgi:hypothetical protein
MLFVRLHYLIPNPKLRRFARRHIVLSYRSDFRALEDLGRQIALKRPQSDIELKQVVAGARRAARESGDERKKSRGASPTVGDVHPRTNPDLARTAADNV